MARKKFNNSGIVYSTDPEFRKSKPEPADGAQLPVAQQKVKIQLDKKQRAGKVVTLVSGLDSSDAEVDAIGKEIKRFCGTGGSAKHGEIIIQGDFRDKVLQWFTKNGYKLSRKI